MSPRSHNLNVSLLNIKSFLRYLSLNLPALTLRVDIIVTIGITALEMPMHSLCKKFKYKIHEALASFHSCIQLKFCSNMRIRIPQQKENGFVWLVPTWLIFLISFYDAETTEVISKKI